MVRGEVINGCNSSTSNEPKLSLSSQQTKHESTPVIDLFHSVICFIDFFLFLFTNTCFTLGNYMKTINTLTQLLMLKKRSVNFDNLFQSTLGMHGHA